MKKLLIALLFAPLVCWAEEGGYRLDHAPIDPNDQVSLQAGARTFVNYCMGCHSANFMRYNRLTDLGLTEQEIKDNLILTGEKVGETMKIAMTPKEGKAWFGVAPPDLSVVARARGADWLYTYLRSFYRDPKTTTGWNNLVFPNVGMPHVLWTLQGEKGLKVVKTPEEDGHERVEYELTDISKGAQNTVGYDTTVRDLVNFLVYVGEPAATSRERIGIVVLFVLLILFALTYALKKEYWKDVK